MKPDQFPRALLLARLAAAACALERHRLARGSYPATLAELAPAFFNAVPLDTFTGQPLGYTRTPDGGSH